MQKLREKIEKELNRFEKELRVDLPKEIGRAAALGDLRENAEYHAALDRQRYLQARVSQLSNQLSQLSTMNAGQIPLDKVGFGSRVTLLDLDNDEEVVFELVFPDDGDVNAGKISISSPIGRALLGKGVGDEVVVKTPGGEREFEVTALETVHQLADSARDGE